MARYELRDAKAFWLLTETPIQRTLQHLV